MKLRDTQWQALLVISPLVGPVLGAYLYALVRGVRVVMRPTQSEDDADTLCGTIFLVSAFIAALISVVAWIVYAVHLWNLER